VDSSRGRWAAQPRRATPATHVQPSEIRPITVLPKVRHQDGNLGTTIVDQNLELPLDGCLGRAMEGKESAKDQGPPHPASLSTTGP
jgi:hypothetical protein